MSMSIFVYTQHARTPGWPITFLVPCNLRGFAQKYRACPILRNCAVACVACEIPRILCVSCNGRFADCKETARTLRRA
ncbi:hypothetical protein PR048_017414 [Dryococelus australis]|uniref:Secreted protein n=1 Tax=Dryococelus australis TaxID=614101 RepID=A0ABQ9H9Q6_9NEOP|nr:hypothetical protein PR048_017414 [Dryococelus australis]